MQIWDYIRELKQRVDLTVLLTTHYLDEAEQLADRVAIMDHGRLVAEGKPEVLIDELGADTVRVLGSGATDKLDDLFSKVDFIQSFSKVDGGFRHQ